MLECSTGFLGTGRGEVDKLAFALGMGGLIGGRRGLEVPTSFFKLGRGGFGGGRLDLLGMVGFTATIGGGFDISLGISRLCK